MNNNQITCALILKKSLRSAVLSVLCISALLLSTTSASALEFKANQWQLVSFPRLPSDASINSVFGEAVSNGQLSAVWTYDNNAQQWESWPAQTNLATSNLTELTLGQGYWVKTSSDLVLSLVDATEAVGEMTLYPGWNLIGLSVDQAMGHEQALAGVPFLELWKYDSDQNKFLSVQKSRGSQIILKEEFSQIEAGLGLWVYMAEQSTLLPSMGTLLPPDIDIEPLLNLSTYGTEAAWDQMTPGDIDWDEDGFFDFPNTQTQVSFGDFLNRQRLSIINEGNGVLSWQATIEPAVDWLLFEAFDEEDQPVLTNIAMGNVSSTFGELVLVGNRTGLAPSDNYKTQIVLRANGSLQEKRIDVSMAVADVVGDYEMTVRLDEINGKQADLHNPKYFLSFARDGEGVKAFLDEERSLLIPQLTYLSGDYVADPESHFQVLGQLYLPQGHEHNPYESDIRREFTIVGQRSNGKDGLSPLDLKGTYSENIYGIFDEPIQLTGEFVGIRLSATPKTKDQSISAIISGEILAEDTSVFELDITDRYSMTDLKTALRIEHPQPEALTVKLTGPQWIDGDGEPQRTTVVLHDKQTRSLTDVRFDDYDTAIGPLDNFDGQLSFGKWTLQIINSATSVGFLNAWNLDISGATVYQLTGTVADAGIRIQVSGCGVVDSVITDPSGNFTFDGLIPCDYELKVLQLGYEISTTNVRIIGCMQDEICNTQADFTQTLDAQQLADLQPQLVTSSGAMKVLVSPSSGQLPITLQAVDVTDYAQLDKTIQSRTWQLFKKVNNITAISDDGYLIDVEPTGGYVPYGKNYISYSENFTQWTSVSRITLEQADVLDPRGGKAAVRVSHSGGGTGTMIRSDDIGEGSFAVKAGDFITISVFAKAGTNDEIRLRFSNNTDYFAAEVLNFTTGEHTGGVDLQSSSIPMANGWYRVSATYKATQDDSEFDCDIWYGDEGTYDVVTPSYMYMFGPQCEVISANGRMDYRGLENKSIAPYSPSQWTSDPDVSITEFSIPNPSGSSILGEVEVVDLGYATFASSASINYDGGEYLYSSLIVKNSNYNASIEAYFNSSTNENKAVKILLDGGEVLGGDVEYRSTPLANDFYLLEFKTSFDNSDALLNSRFTMFNETGAKAPVGSKIYVQAAFFGEAPLVYPYAAYNEFNTASEWTFSDGSHTQLKNYIKTLNTGGSFAYLKKSNLDFNGSDFDKVKIRWKIITGNSSMQFRWYYPDASSIIAFRTDTDSTYAKTISDSGWYITTFDLSSHSEWVGTDISQIRFDIGEIIGDEYEIDYVKVYSSNLLEKHDANWPATYTAPKPLNEITASAYIPTEANHTERSINGQQEVLIAEQNTGLSGSFSHKFTNLRANAGAYFVKLNSDVKNASNQDEQISFQTEDVLAFKNPEDIHLGSFSSYGAGGTASLKAMDMATYDLDRFPLVSESGSQGLEDSDGFKADDIEGDEYQTNAPNNVNEISPGVFSVTPTGLDAPAGNLNQQYRMYISTGQLYQGGSMYSGSVRLDVGIQSQQESN